ncbi:flagellar motor protein MotB [Arthrobacter tecti]
MSPRPGRRRRSADEGEEHPDERWMASYMDMVTVLMCMFIVLFAMSTVDQKKFEQLRNSLATGFGAVEVAAVDTAEGIVVPPERVNEEGPAAELTDLDLAMIEVENLRALQEKIDAGLTEKNLQDAVRYEIDERGLTVRLVSSKTFFLPDSAVLTPQTVDVLDIIGPALTPTEYKVSVEGHTAKLPDGSPEPLDWELSTERSVNVVRHLVGKSGLQPNRAAAVGFGESRPLAAGMTEEELQLNRRVDIVALSNQPENVRALIPELVGETP